ncbi:MAG: hypothetical protein DWQ30_04730 [Acidobacteria bacterium]|nr:MAG: hypothetical protein DWQ30_04730 [Acidobacteriota bacterium]
MKLDRAVAPAVSPPEELALPRLQRPEAAVELVVCHDPRPLVHCTWVLRHGGADETIARAGEFPLAVDLLDEGTRRRLG